MSVCDVPLCPNLTIGGPQNLMGASKGVSRINQTANETRDRLRIRLHHRKMRASNKNTSKYTYNPNVTYSVQSGTLSKISEQVNYDKSNVLKLNGNKQITHDEKPITNLIKKTGIDSCPLKTYTQPKNGTKKCEVKECSMHIKCNNNKANMISKDKENKSVEYSESILRSIRYEADFEDIDKIIKFIEGKDYEIAQKKAAKKARQKQRKEDEKRKKEEEEEQRRQAEEQRIWQEKRLEEERMKAEQAALKKSKKNKQQAVKLQNDASKGKKKKKKSENIPSSNTELLEETIPAMVTIKRIIENNNSPPTVTITLKGSTPDQDKLLYTLVNGHNNRNPKNNSDSRHNACLLKAEECRVGKKKKNSQNDKQKRITTTNELKVTLSVDRSFRKELESKKQVKIENKKHLIKEVKKLPFDKSEIKETILDIPSLKLPPGITITKVNGPLSNRKSNNMQSSDYSNVPVNKSGVIVVDTEKLIQQSNGSKKSKKKKKKTQPASVSEESAKSESCMVTLKNPNFQSRQNKLINKSDSTSTSLIDINEQATISKGENGMVTIRRPRPMSLQRESPVSDYLKPVIHSNLTETLSEEKKNIRPPSPRSSNNSPNSQFEFDSNRISAQNILWGLPGIQITRVNKNTINECEISEQTADVSIIRTGGFNLDKDDWPYESVFTPKDILEDDLDADERELEAFKRFCQQSVPPKHKEKVAHLNVKDIVLVKKNDVTYS